jgi:hypothetical protein
MTRAPLADDARVSRKAVWGGEVSRRIGLLFILALTLLVVSCGDMTRQGTGSSYLIINALEAASGAEPSTFGGTLNSDVVTVVDDVPTIFNDIGRVRLSLAMKDAGGVDLPTSPTTNNYITVNRYHVRYIRADGRNTPGVDVPYPFDGAFTGTVGAGEFTAGFELVRHIAKSEAPLGALARNFVIISTIAEVTFYGRDQTGREASVTGQILVSFGNFGDPG